MKVKIVLAKNMEVKTRIVSTNKDRAFAVIEIEDVDLDVSGMGAEQATRIRQIGETLVKCADDLDAVSKREPAHV